MSIRECRKVLVTSLMAFAFWGHLLGVSISAPAPAVDRNALQERLTTGGLFESQSALAGKLARSIPPVIAANLLLGSDPRAIQVKSEYIEFAAPSRTDTTMDDLGLCVFSGQWSVYVAVARISGESASIVWDTTYGFELPQPRLWIDTLGIEKDADVVIGMSGLVSARGHISYVFLLWSGDAAVLLGGVNGLWVDEEDVDGDGIVDLIAALEDEDKVDAKTGRPATRYEVWKLNTSDMMFQNSPELTQKYLQQRSDNEK